MRLHKRAILALGLASSTPRPARAEEGRLRMRAREHYETVDVASAGGHATYWGFTNTIDLWYEVPFRYSVGLAGSPLLATLHSAGPAKGLSDTIRLVHLGVEAKVYPWEAAGVFLRGGAFQATLASYASAGTLTGESGLAGLGYEWIIGGVGIAPEVDWRRAVLQKGVVATAFAPCVGFHFYHFF